MDQGNVKVVLEKILMKNYKFERESTPTKAEDGSCPSRPRTREERIN